MKKILPLSLLCLGIMGGARAQTCGTTISSYPYIENFDGATAPGWTSGGTNSSWALGTPVKTTINSAASGTKSWVTNLTGQYNLSENSWVQSPCFNMSTLLLPVVEMKIWWNSEFSWDGAVLQSSIDGGTTWQNVGAQGDPNNWYNDNTIYGSPGGQPEGWTGTNSNSSGGWVTAKHALTGLGGKPNVRLRIAFGADNYMVDEGFAFDNFNVYDTPANDAGVTSITSPVSPVTPLISNPVMVTVKNYGTSPLTAATLGFSVNKVVQPTFSWTAPSPLAPNATSAPVTIGNFAFPAGIHTIRAWSKSPNGAADGNPGNDTTSITINSCNSLSGAYTINKGAVASATNFTSFSAAAQMLASCGISGAVTFNVVSGSGPYTEQVVLPVIPGTSASNTVTFEGNGNTLTGTPATSDQGVLTFNGADFVKFNNLTVTLNAAATAGSAVQLTNASDNDIISNCTVNLPISSTAYNMNAITASAASGNVVSNLLLQNNTINGGYYGIQIDGLAATSTGNKIIGNQVKDAYNYGIYVANATGSIIEANDISRPTRTNGGSFYAIYLSGTAESSIISKNRIHNTHDVATTLTNSVYGIYVSSTAPAGSENIIMNNIMYNINNLGGNFYAIYNDYASGAYYYHNTISADNPAMSYGIVHGAYFSSGSTNVKFQNNVLSLSSPATSKHAIYVTNMTMVLISNSNNLYIGNSGNIGYFAGTNLATLADWKTVNSSAYDQNSISANPIFVSVATGNLQPSSGMLNNIAQPLASVLTDITGATRSTTTPDIGAYEFTPAAKDVGATAIITPNSGCGLTNLETVSITLNNFGTAAQSNIPVSYTINGGTAVNETFAGPLAPGASVTYTFAAKANLATPNTYTIEVQSNLTGDAIPLNNAFTKIVNSIPVVNTFPYTQNFEAGNGGWTSGGSSSSWALGTPAKTVINSAASGTKAWVTSLTGQYNPSENSYVVGPCFNFSTLVAPIFEMKVWWNAEFSWDGAVLQSSIDGGTTWVNVGVNGDPNNWYNDNNINGGPGGQPGTTAEGWTGRTLSTNGSNGWVSVKHALTGLGNKPSVMLRIAFGADPAVNDDGFAFDDVLIYETPANDGGVTAIVSPNSSCGLTSQETVTITVKNFGTTPQSNIPVSYTINAGTPVTAVVPGPVAPNATVNYSFTTKANLGTSGTYTIVAKTNIPGDGITPNDATTKIVTAMPSISTLPYTEGFENGNGGWVAGGTASSWALGTPAKAVINSAGAGTKSWVTNLTGQYNPNENSYVVGPCFNFTGIADPDFEMKAWWNSEYSWDGAVLQSSIDGGATWQNVGQIGDPTNWYNDNSINGAPGGQPFATAEGWTGSAINQGSNGWVKVKHKLTGLGGKASVQLRVAFGSDPAVTDDGFAFDEIRISDNTNNMALNSVVPINKLCGFGSSEPITAVIENLGSTPATGFTVSYTVNAGTPVTQVYTASLAAGATTNFTFAQAANLATAGNYTIVVTVNLTGDPDATNNSATYSISNASFTGLPPVFNFEPAGAGVTQLRTVTKPKSNIAEDVAASFSTGSTKGMLMDGVDHVNWVSPAGITDTWTSNADNFSGAYICFNPGGGGAKDTLRLTFDLKQLFKTSNTNTNFRVTVNGTQVGPTYRPPFTGSPINWQHVTVDLSQYQTLAGLQIGLESSVKEAYDNGNGTANLIDNINIVRIAGPTVSTGMKDNSLQSNVQVFPNPSNGLFHVVLPQGKGYKLMVTDLSGKVIRNQITATENNVIDMTGTAKGVYLLKVVSANACVVRKLVIE